MSLASLSLDELAGHEAAQGTPLVHHAGQPWRRLRGLFYQPLMPMGQYPIGSLRPPPSARLGGWQHAVGPGETGNSALAYLVFEHPGDYSEAVLDKKRRRQTRIAAAKFDVRPIPTVGEFVDKAYPVYLDFQSRTQYDVFVQRRQREVFSRWAEGLYQRGKLMILGAYEGGELHAVGIGYRMETLVSYAAFFSSTAAQPSFVSDLMLHRFRERAAAEPGVRRVLATRFRGEGHSLDQFYMLRGATVVVQDAQLHINPIANMALKLFFPSRHGAVWGRHFKQAPPEGWASPRDGVRELSHPPGGGV